MVADCSCSASDSKRLSILSQYFFLPAKVQHEIDEVVGANRIPSMEDRLKMPFTNAVIHEAQRCWKDSLEAFPRATTCDIKFHGHNLPKVWWYNYWSRYSGEDKKNIWLNVTYPEILCIQGLLNIKLKISYFPPSLQRASHWPILFKASENWRLFSG